MGGVAATRSEAIGHTVAKGARVIDIPQDADTPITPDSRLGRAVGRAVGADVVVIASAGNDGLTGRKCPTYPAAFPGSSASTRAGPTTCAPSCAWSPTSSSAAGTTTAPPT
ncbi:hypothetical protein ACFWCB_00070 [Streptomyces sp. NPDC060048]|uniref:hypothetical protein n=1 Tax=unclassified Streptomyces TaxID=2593676 RepID=UPI003683E0BB